MESKRKKLCNDSRAAEIKDGAGNLPIHVVVERKDIVPPVDVIMALMTASPKTLRVKDKGECGFLWGVCSFSSVLCCYMDR